MSTCPRLLLAPMEGLLDHTLRDALTRAGGISRCVSEFIRITDQLLPHRVFARIVPEQLHGWRTPAGVLVRPQLLGSDPACLADNAARVAEMGAPGIDLNFGCPAKIVNRHGGGATLLDEPELLYRIARAVRAGLPEGVPLSAKMRLGNQDDSRSVACALALVEGGVCELVVHARTKAQAYRPPAYWEKVAAIRQAVAVPLVANGEIWTLADALACRAASGCEALMLGRGMVANPGLALAIVAHDARASDPSGLSWAALQPLLQGFWASVCAHIVPRNRAGRLKQWLNYLRRHYPEAQRAYAALRTENDPQRLALRLFSEFAATPSPCMHVDEVMA
ncbi:MAG: tRNA dihydrouridine(16) synthase DusC [Ideonella sp. MAG2]|nr:MAG: tRNA dihydrouridine(16) synthase DusC [Ideonella sp. MAG2]